MELSLARCQQVLDTLPIGYYTGRRIPVEMDAKAETSFYSPMEDKIVVSYPIIAHRASQMKGNDDENAVRSMLYHEVSHAILTPSDMRADAVTNIFEDERIETLLQDYYYDVDFKQQLFDIHSGTAPKVTDAESAFYAAVRFRQAPQKILEKIENLITKYQKLNRASAKYDSEPCHSRYVNDIYALYREIAKEYSSNPEDFKQKSSKTKLAESKENQNKKKKQQETESEEMMDDFKPDRAIRKMCEEALSKEPELDDAACERLNDFQKIVEMIIGNFKKKNSGGSGINAYSGIFNPRAVARQDYRYFERAMTTQGNNKFGTCHLNLIIDCSGSYYNNVGVTNGILRVLSEVERKNRNFSMDVCFINHEFKKCETIRERVMKAWGGNSIPKDMKQILMNLQKPNTCNYNIVLFDGDAVCDNYEGMDIARKLFSVFDMKQTTLITDPENQKYINNSFTSTKVVITENYTEELIKHIQNALTIAFN